MTLLEMIQQEAAPARRNVLVIAALTGIANAAVLTVINEAAGLIPQLSIRYLVMFVLAVGLYVACARYTFRHTALIFETVLHKVKLTITEKVQGASFREIERLGAAELHDRISENLAEMSDAASLTANVLQSLVIIIVGALYLAWLSLTALAIETLVVFTTVLYYRASAALVKQHLKQVAQTRLAFFDLLNDLLQGFRAIKANTQRSKEFRADLVELTGDIHAHALQVTNIFDDSYILGRVALFLLLGGIVFILPMYTQQSSDFISRLMTVILFIVGPIGAVVSGLPTFLRANVAMSNIRDLELKLDQAAEIPAAAALDPWHGCFTAVQVEALEFRYDQPNSDQPFLVGPVSLTIHSGEVLFLVGGNGSGKSTLLKVLTGLYMPHSGVLRVDGVDVTPWSAQAFRELISAVYAEIHLFKKLYGLGAVDPERVNELLRRLHLDHKTSFRNGGFSTLDLSTGQRKRLALIVALLEDRPIYAFDEWASDQDPESRRYFYEELIPELKRRGKTVLVVTHDDRYFSCADRVVVMEYGRIRTIQNGSELV